MEDYKHLRPEELELSVVDREAMVVINGLARTFNTSDTAIWVYPERFAMLNHLVQWHGDSAERWYGLDQDTIDTLHEAGVTMVTPPYPIIEIVGEWWAVEMADFDKELKHFAQTGNLE